eukprot:jgi/Mesvir1/24968/Mv16938-RA.1
MQACADIRACFTSCERQGHLSRTSSWALPTASAGFLGQPFSAKKSRRRHTGILKPRLLPSSTKCSMKNDNTADKVASVSGKPVIDGRRTFLGQILAAGLTGIVAADAGPAFASAKLPWKDINFPFGSDELVEDSKLRYMTDLDDVPQTPVIAYSDFLDMLEAGMVSRVRFQGATHMTLILKEPTRFYKPLMERGHGEIPIEEAVALPARIKFSVLVPANDPMLISLLRQQHVVVIADEEHEGFFEKFGNFIEPLLLIGVLYFALLSGEGGPGGILKSKARMVDGGKTGVAFSDVAGCDEAKAELEEVVGFLKNSERYRSVGGRVPKGVLLCGPAGTGKTLLARAVAGEADVPFFSIAGSEFVELFVGLGASRVRKLFSAASKKAPCIIFIDELDAIGKSRSGGDPSFGGVANEEREQTLNQLLTEMDGFEGRDGKPIIVLAATNRPEVLDKALKRPGRFDRTVVVGRPDKKGREAILKLNLQKVAVGTNVDVSEVAAATTGFTGADLANVVNEAALLAARSGKAVVELPELQEAMERSMAGLERRSLMVSPKERTTVAYHECGHALVGVLAPTSVNGTVQKVSIVPRGSGALGYTLRAPEEDRFLLGEDEMRAFLVYVRAHMLASIEISNLYLS